MFNLDNRPTIASPLKLSSTANARHVFRADYHYKLEALLLRRITDTLRTQLWHQIGWLISEQRTQQLQDYIERECDNAV